MTGTPSSPPRLLLVTEDEDLGEALREFLRDEGYVAFVATSVEDALALMTTQTFDLILSDFFRQRDQVPYHSVERLSLLAQPIPVGIMSASNLSAEEVEQRGFAYLLKKPFGLDDLRTAIVACLQGR